MRHYQNMIGHEHDESPKNITGHSHNGTTGGKQQMGLWSVMSSVPWHQYL